MPHDKIAKMSGVPHVHASKGSDFEHNPNEQFGGMKDTEMRKFMKEEQAEGMHPSLKHKHF